MKEKTKNILSALGITSCLAASAYFYYENNFPEVVKYSFVSKKISKETRIVSLSDLHNKSFGRENKKLLSEIIKINPSLILFPGDTISHNSRDFRKTLKFLSILSKRCPIVMILGNHENRRDDLQNVIRRYKESGAIVLQNEEVKIGEISILGLDEKLAVSKRDYLKAAFNVLKYENHDADILKFSQKDGYKILLSHFPENYALIGQNSYSKFDFDLMLSGHAHGGQWNIYPFGPIFSPGQGLFPKYVSGLHGNIPKLIVSRGLGNDCPLPRINNRPEITYIKLIPED